MADSDKKCGSSSSFQKIDKNYATNQPKQNPQAAEVVGGNSRSTTESPDPLVERKPNIRDIFPPKESDEQPVSQEKVKAIAVVAPMRVEKKEDEEESDDDYEEEYQEDADDESDESEEREENNTNVSHNTGSAFTFVLPKNYYPIDSLAMRNMYAHLFDYPPPTPPKVATQIVQQGGVPNRDAYFETSSNAIGIGGTSHNDGGISGGMQFSDTAYFQNFSHSTNGEYQGNVAAEKRNLKRGVEDDENVQEKRKKEESLNLPGDSDEEDTDSSSEQ